MRKYHSRRLFWYQPQLLTPNSEGERSIQSWDVDFTSSQGAVCFKYKGNIKECQRIVAWSISYSKWHLWNNRSPSLFGVRRCSWYQNNRRELYFRVLWFVFTFETPTFLVLWKNHQNLCSKPNFFTLDFAMSAGKIQENLINIWMMPMPREYVIVVTTK